MKINAIEILKVQLPMKRTFETSFGKITNKPTVIVKLYSDGLVGYGESAAFDSPLYNPETVDTCIYIIKNFVAPIILHQNFKNPKEIKQKMDFIVGHNIAKAGVENAFWHLKAQKENISLKKTFNGKYNQIPVGESIGIQPSINETLKEVERALNKGFLRIKIKIKPGWDIKLVKEVRKRWQNIDLMVDGNSAYSLKNDMKTLLEFDNYNLTMIEQPLSEDDIIDHSTLQRLIETPICLDESITSLDKARKAITTGACKIINIKPVRVGGASESMAIHDYCFENNVGVWCGGMLESGIGRAFNIALASKHNFVYPSDMSTYNEFYKADLVSDSHTISKNGTVTVKNTTGLGYKVDEKSLKKFTSERIYLE